MNYKEFIVKMEVFRKFISIRRIAIAMDVTEHTIIRYMKPDYATGPTGDRVRGQIYKHTVEAFENYKLKVMAVSL